jgi:hypothetical protein
VSPFQSFRTAAWAEYAEEREREEVDRRERRKGYRTGAGVHKEGECEGERAERSAAQKAATT